MAYGVNKAILIGRVQPNDPELRYTQTGQAVCSFKLVTDESYKDKEGNKVERAEWHHIVAWGKAGEILAQYAKKGSQLYIEGRIQTRKYEDKEGQTRYMTEINVSEFSFLGGGAREEGTQSGGSISSGSAESSYAAPVSAHSATDDDLPF
jgi:single-strand DNA-binding protein